MDVEKDVESGNSFFVRSTLLNSRLASLCTRSGSWWRSKS